MHETDIINRDGVASVKPVINLLHGWGMNAAVFNPLVDTLSARYRVISINLPGYGGSDFGDADFERHLDHLEQRLEQGLLVGWSLGGLYAMGLARRSPGRFSGLLLVASNPCFVQRDGWRAAMPREMFVEFADSLAADWQATIRRFIGLQLHGADNARELIRIITTLVTAGGAPDPRALEFGLRLLSDVDMRNELANLAIPTLAILGRRDKLVPASLGQQLALLNPSIRVECLARSAHAPFLSHEAEFTGLLDEFVESTQAG
jgi:pimeloyl-[acyl-carrier protein] methyl ester esterase